MHTTKGFAHSSNVASLPRTEPTLVSKQYRNLTVHYRPGTSDERVLVEVIDKQCYRKPASAFFVEPGEHWLDLGANIGAFAVYCRLRGAIATCYEPDEDSFKILRMNAPWFKLFNMAVTEKSDRRLWLYRSPRANDHYRSTVFPSVRFVNKTLVKNFCAEALRNMRFDGVKMDIEGSEGPIIDRWFLPYCRKLILEYHTSKDPSVSRLKQRLKILQQHFSRVHYFPEFDRVINSGAIEFKAYFDRLVYAWGPLTIAPAANNRRMRGIY